MFHFSTGRRMYSVGPAWETLCYRGVLSDETVVNRPDLASRDRITDDPEKVTCPTCKRRMRGGKQHSQYPKEDR